MKNEKTAKIMPKLEPKPIEAFQAYVYGKNNRWAAMADGAGELVIGKTKAATENLAECITMNEIKVIKVSIVAK